VLGAGAFVLDVEVEGAVAVVLELVAVADREPVERGFATW
jgi:hypothetical protein